MNKIFFLFLMVCFPAITWISCSKSNAATANKNNSAPISKAYSLISLKEQALGNTLRLPAQLSAFESVDIYPKVSGYIKSILVDIGSEVKKGQILMEIEAPEVELNNLSAHEKFIKAEASFNSSKDSYYRLLNTAKTSGAVSPNDLESAQSKMQSDSAWRNSENANWKAMESMKDYLIVRAPFNGTITQRNIHPGAFVAVGKMEAKPMLELQEISKLRLEVKVPETFAPQLENNQKVSFLVEAIPGKSFTGNISRQAYSLDEKYRSESVEMDVININKILMPGMYAEVLLPLKGHSNAYIVPQSAVVTSTEKKYVIKVNNDKAVLVNITTGNEDKGMVEIFGDVKDGDSIVEKASEEIVQDQSIITTK